MVGATGFEPATTCTPSGPGSRATITKSSQLFGILGSPSTLSVQGSQPFPALRRDFATNLLPAIEQLLTVRQVAELLGVCPATVYKWAATGDLPHIRIVNVIRIRAQDLTTFAASGLRRT